MSQCEISCISLSIMPVATSSSSGSFYSLRLWTLPMGKEDPHRSSACRIQFTSWPKKCSLCGAQLRALPNRESCVCTRLCSQRCKCPRVHQGAKAHCPKEGMSMCMYSHSTTVEAPQASRAKQGNAELANFLGNQQLISRVDGDRPRASVNP